MHSFLPNPTTAYRATLAALVQGFLGRPVYPQSGLMASCDMWAVPSCPRNSSASSYHDVTAVLAYHLSLTPTVLLGGIYCLAHRVPIRQASVWSKMTMGLQDVSQQQPCRGCVSYHLYQSCSAEDPDAGRERVCEETGSERGGGRPIVGAIPGRRRVPPGLRRNAAASERLSGSLVWLQTCAQSGRRYDEVP